jgi:hypothetical protein
VPYENILGAGWNLISFNVRPDSLNVLVVMRSVLERLRVMVNNAGKAVAPNVFRPGQWINNIGEVDVRQGYRVYMSTADTIRFEGQEVDPQTPIPVKTGWNLVAYLPKQAQGALGAVQRILGRMRVMVNNRGDALAPNAFTPDPNDWIDYVVSVQPGQGYRVYVSAADTLIYPSGSAKVLVVGERSLGEIPQHFRSPEVTGEVSVVLVGGVTVGGHPLETGDEVGVVGETGQCLGAVRVTGPVTVEQPVLVLVWRDDPMTEGVDGYQPGERMAFRMWQARSQREVPMEAIYVEGTARLGEAPLVAVTLIGEGRDESANRQGQPVCYTLAPVVPNPFNPAVAIRYELPQAGMVVVVIYDLLGRQVRMLVEADHDAGWYTVVWDGRDEGGQQVGSGVYLVRLKAGAFTQSRKMVLLK